MNWYLKVLKNYAAFGGRARRAEYWWFVLFNFLATLALIIVDSLIGLSAQAGGIGILSGIYTLAVLIPGVAVAIRRLHDSGRSGWWFLISLVPFVGGIILLVFLVLDSQPDSNQWGPNPKNEVA
jgi:uncharacterized membrane protein YhaH (DUF805 family)